MTHDWQTEYARALEAFGDPPGNNLETELRQAFTTHPQAVTNAITKTIKAHTKGTIHSPWGILKHELPKQIKADTTVGDGTERKRAISSAKQWITNSGIHCPTWTEAEHELYERRNGLQSYTNDTELRDELKQLWTIRRPLAVAVAEAELQRADNWKQTRAAIDTLPKVPVNSHT